MRDSTLTERTVFVGLDYHDQSVQVCVLDRQGRIQRARRCPNDVAALVACVPPGVPVQAALEASTGTAALADDLAAQAGWTVSLAHPAYVAASRRSPDKSDWQDGRLLADLQRVGYLPQVWRAPPAVRGLRQLVGYRQGVVAQRRAAKLAIRALLREHRVTAATPAPATAWTKRWRTWLEREVALPAPARWLVSRHLARLDWAQGEARAVETKLAELTAEDPLVAALRQLPGIGPVTAWVLRAKVGRFDRFRSGKQLARYCGLSPRNASSGARQADGGLIGMADPYLRSILIELAQRLTWARSGHWRHLFDQLVARGKPRNLAVAALANRYVRWLFHQVKAVLPPEAAAGRPRKGAGPGPQG